MPREIKLRERLRQLFCWHRWENVDRGYVGYYLFKCRKCASLKMEELL